MLLSSPPPLLSPSRRGARSRSSPAWWIALGVVICMAIALVARSPSDASSASSSSSSSSSSPSSSSYVTASVSSSSTDIDRTDDSEDSFAEDSSNGASTSSSGGGSSSSSSSSSSGSGSSASDEWRSGSRRRHRNAKHETRRSSSSSSSSASASTASTASSDTASRNRGPKGLPTRTGNNNGNSNTPEDDTLSKIAAGSANIIGNGGSYDAISSASTQQPHTAEDSSEPAQAHTEPTPTTDSPSVAASAFSLFAGLLSPPASRPPIAFTLTVVPPKNEVMVRVENLSNQVLSMLLWHTPFENPLSAGIYVVSDTVTGQRMVYRGFMVRRATPNGADFMILKPHEQHHIMIKKSALVQAYLLRPSITYSVQFSQLISFVHGEVYPDSTFDQRFLHAESNTVSFSI